MESPVAQIATDVKASTSISSQSHCAIPSPNSSKSNVPTLVLNEMLSDEFSLGLEDHIPVEVTMVDSLDSKIQKLNEMLTSILQKSNCAIDLMDLNQQSSADPISKSYSLVQKLDSVLTELTNQSKSQSFQIQKLESKLNFTVKDKLCLSDDLTKKNARLQQLTNENAALTNDLAEATNDLKACKTANFFARDELTQSKKNLKKSLKLINQLTNCNLTTDTLKSFKTDFIVNSIKSEQFQNLALEPIASSTQQSVNIPTHSLENINNVSESTVYLSKKSSLASTTATQPHRSSLPQNHLSPINTSNLGRIDDDQSYVQTATTNMSRVESDYFTVGSLKPSRSSILSHNRQAGLVTSPTSVSADVTPILIERSLTNNSRPAKTHKDNEKVASKSKTRVMSQPTIVENQTSNFIYERRNSRQSQDRMMESQLAYPNQIKKQTQNRKSNDLSRIEINLNFSDLVPAKSKRQSMFSTNHNDVTAKDTSYKSYVKSKRASMSTEFPVLEQTTSPSRSIRLSLSDLNRNDVSANIAKQNNHRTRSSLDVRPSKESSSKHQRSRSSIDVSHFQLSPVDKRDQKSSSKLSKMSLFGSKS
ncbi:hypothetical protein BC833DRAFT_623431 [Globomyces pollinis-pini]|nr:hypothetical protein BC833DRAFT_623431 [Globomyces pollinis-pini]